LFARSAAKALSAFVSAGATSEAAQNLSEPSRATLDRIAEEFNSEEFGDRDLPREIRKPLYQRLSSWALDPRNWYLVASDESPFTMQARVWSGFPCLVFENGPIECSGEASNSDVELERLEDILQTTGVYGLWSSGHLGRGGTAVVLDTGVSQRLVGNSIHASAVTGLSPIDVDGHGSAVVSVIRALSPQSRIESICVSQSYSGGQIWNLISALSQLYPRNNIVVNISLGASPEWVRGLGAQAVGFQDSISNLLASLAAVMNFTISAAGNDGLPDLRWPAASLDSLAVASHNSAFTLSSFSNFREGAQNLILAPGGDVRRLDGKIEAFGHYGQSLAREIYGTSFSTAIASAIACLLMEYDRFRHMLIGSRISLFTNHCRRNDRGFPILNLTDVGAVWPL